MPAKSKLTREIIKKIAGHVAKGLTNNDACRLVFINESTLYRWLAKAEGAQSGLYFELQEALKKAEAGFKETHVGIIVKAATEPSKRTHVEEISEPGPPDENGKPTVKVVRTKATTETIPPQWQASAWLLRNKFSDEFSTDPGKKRRRKR